MCHSLGNRTTSTLCVGNEKCQRDHPRFLPVHSHFSYSGPISELFWPWLKSSQLCFPLIWSQSEGFQSCSKLHRCCQPQAWTQHCLVCFASKSPDLYFFSSGTEHDSQPHCLWGKHFQRTHWENQNKTFGQSFASPPFSLITHVI